MAFTDTDVTALETAIASGSLTVQHGDQSTTYRSMAELFEARDRIKRELAINAGGSRFKYYNLTAGYRGDR